MLIPAIIKKAELLEKFSREIYSEKYFWYNGYSYCHSLPEIKAEDQLYQYAIVNKSNDVIGFFTYRVDPYINSVSNFGLYSFSDNNIIVALDVRAKIKELVKQYRRVEWVVIGGNNVKKNYDRFCKKHGGRILEFRDTVRDENGNYHNSYVYEILNVT